MHLCIPRLDTCCISVTPYLRQVKNDPTNTCHSFKCTYDSFTPISMVWFSTVCHFFSFPLSEAVNGSTIANRLVPLFWDPSVGLPSTVVQYLKGGARLTAGCWLVDRESSLVRASRGMTAKGEWSVSFTCSAMLPMCVGLVYTKVCKHKKYNNVF